MLTVFCARDCLIHSNVSSLFPSPSWSCCNDPLRFGSFLIAIAEPFLANGGDKGGQKTVCVGRTSIVTSWSKSSAVHTTFYWCGPQRLNHQLSRPTLFVHYHPCSSMITQPHLFIVSLAECQKNSSRSSCQYFLTDSKRSS
jgi:hypothetical protein